MTKVLVAGGSGFIGRRFVDLALGADLNLHVLTRSPTVGAQLEAQGVHPVVGDLLTPGEWQWEAARADLGVYIAGPPTWGRRLSKRLAERYRDGMLAMTKAFFGSLNPDRVQRVIYVAGTSYYGDTGDEPAVEGQPPQPRGTGPYIAPSVRLAQGYGAAGYPTIITQPGAVYGPGSWLAQLILEPLLRGKTIPSVKGYDPAISVVHLHDCARALLHLLQHGQPGQEYFVADDLPVTLGDIVAIASDLTGIPAKTRAYPRWLSKLAIGPILTDAASGNVVVSNQKLKQTGLTLTYPSMHEGLGQVIDDWRATQAAAVPR